MKNICFVLLAFFIFSCNKKNDVVRSFCYWKTDLKFNSDDDSIIKDLKLKHMFVRFFDVDWSSSENEPVPVADIQNIYLNKSNIEITPSVFITNEVFLKASKPQLDTLALRIIKRIEEITENKRKIRIKAIYPKIDFKEILIDCDWSPKSKQNYFYLLGLIKKNAPQVKITATIRLWQYKYATKAGTPPVDKGLLMCYNITKPNDINTKNSIGTSAELAQYITHNKYKLKLDVALPLYSWAVVFRGGQYKGIISDYEKLMNDSIPLKQIAPENYILKQDMLLGNTYLRNGDLIRVEKISNDELDKMISIVKRKIEIDNQTKISFFSFDKKHINNYGIQNLSEYYARF
jgi:hypothetical protein